MFDSFYDATGREWQSKAFDCSLQSYSIGDSVTLRPTQREMPPWADSADPETMRDRDAFDARAEAARTFADTAHVPAEYLVYAGLVTYSELDRAVHGPKPGEVGPRGGRWLEIREGRFVGVTDDPDPNLSEYNYRGVLVRAAGAHPQADDPRIGSASPAARDREVNRHRVGKTNADNASPHRKPTLGGIRAASRRHLSAVPNDHTAPGPAGDEGR